MAGRKRIDIDIGFNTDTSRAKAQIQDLQKQIVNLSVAAKQNTATNTLSSDISKAVIEASKLNGILSQSMTFKGDNLDLSKFVTNLNKSGTTISQVRKNLESLGPQGQKAFTSLAQSIMSAEVPLRQSEGLLKSFSTTLTNSIKWTVFIFGLIFTGLELYKQIFLNVIKKRDGYDWGAFPSQLCSTPI